MILLAFILAGKGAHSLQDAGLIPVSSMALTFRFDLSGVYPSVQTILAQLAILLVFAWVLMVERLAILQTQNISGSEDRFAR